MNRVLTILPNNDFDDVTTVTKHLLPSNILLSDVTRNDSINGSARVTEGDFDLDTKYYDAKLHFTFVPIVEDTTQKFSDQLLRYNLNCLEQNAVILVYKNDFSLLRNFAEYLIGIGANFDTCLVVSTSNYISDTVRTWCIDNGYEWIGEDESLHSDDRNTLGVERVIEALSCTMWPHMTKKDPNAKKPTTPQQEKKKEEIDLNELGDDDGEDDLEQLFAAMMKLRNEGHNMDHDQRKKEAAILATKLFGMMGEDDDE
ncbi:alpha- and gamma-adaptin-binding protein [Acrasis kona]|uniref:Alpha- and gamma-adaptin-binding protein n=1 Tax=Acrasis kona TaxID=1008807 RepID=A0AAW2ZD18_9EUKA